MRKRERSPSGSVSRRDFLRVGGTSVVGLTVAERAALARRRPADRRSCVFLLMTGGPSQFETFDPKPDAPAEIRGPLKSIETAVPGLRFSESLPELAARADRFTTLRSLWHDAAPIHETGLQLIQTGALARGDRRPPGFGASAAAAKPSRLRVPPWVVLPRLLGNTGVQAHRGQTAGWLGSRFDPVSAVDDEDRGPAGDFASLAHEPEPVRRAYGDTRFGRLCLKARQLVECGVRVVVVNLFDELAGQVTWDCHGRGPGGSATLYDYRDELGPAFDRAASALLDDMAARGLLDDTLVVATGEFGRTPRVNGHGGRDHWPGVWSGLVAGGGVPAGGVLGGSDPRGSAPVDRPVHPSELVATITRFLGVEPDATLEPSAEPLVATRAPVIDELLG